MVKGQENLIPLNKRTKEEQKKIASKGGKKSGEVRAEKKQFKKAIEWLANSDIKMTKGITFEIFKNNNIDISKLDTTQLATIGLWFGAVQGNANNFKTLMEGNNEIGIETPNTTPTLKIEVVDNSKLEGALYEENRHNKDDERK